MRARVAVLTLVLAACSAGDFRAIHFSDYRIVPASKRIEAPVAVEVSYVRSPGAPGGVPAATGVRRSSPTTSLARVTASAAR